MTEPRHRLPAQRRRAMLRAVRAGPAHVSDLAEDLGVSEMTVRRDLRELAREGKLERVRGGAVQAGGEPPFEETVSERFAAKDRIGAAAAGLVRDGETVMIDIGTTTLQAAHHLHGRSLTVITTSLAVYEELLPDHAIELLLPGGIVRRNYRSLVGRDRRGLAAPAAGRHRCSLARARSTPARRLGHDDGRGADQARDDRGRRAGRAAGRR